MICAMQRRQRGRDYGGRGLNGGRARHWRMSGLKIAKGVRGDNWSEGWLRNRWPDFKAQKTSSAVPGSLLAPHAETAYGAPPNRNQEPASESGRYILKRRRRAKKPAPTRIWT